MSPRPAAMLVRRVIAENGGERARRLAALAPTNVVELIDERYGESRDMLFDLFHPDTRTTPMPVLMWIHGGAWIGGSKDELAGYFKIVAAEGYSVVALRYSLAPESHYPTPLRQIMHAFRYLQTNATALRVDMSRVVIAGDSAGAQLAAQVAALVTTPGYAETVGVRPTITAQQLRGVVLACGPYDIAQLASTASVRRLVEAVLWAYTGHRRALDDPQFASLSVLNHLSGAFPPALVTVGNVDPLRRQSELLVAKLRESGLVPETLFFPKDYAPRLDHEYQFDLDTEPARMFLARLHAFLGRYLLVPTRRAG